MKKFVHDANMWYNMSRFTKKERNMETEQTLKSNVLESDVKNYLSTLRKQKEVNLEEVNQFFDLYLHLEQLGKTIDLNKLTKSFFKTMSKMNEKLSIYIEKNMASILFKMKRGLQLLDIVVVPDTHLIAPVYEKTETEVCNEYLKEKRNCQLKRGAYVFGNDFNLQEKQFLKEHAISIFDEPEKIEVPKQSFIKTLRYKLHTFL